MYWLSPLSHASETAQLCRPVTDVTPPLPSLPPPPPSDKIRLFADQALVKENEGISTFQGNVLVQRNNRVLQAEFVTYDRQADKLEANNKFTFWDEQFLLQGEHLKLYGNDRGEMRDAHYWLLKEFREDFGYGRGFAQFIRQKDKDHLRLTNTSYTTCQQETPIWELNAQETYLDNENAIGESWHTVVRVLGIPVFYTPYLSFPLNNDRKSGFLSPSVGSSNKVGTEFAVPYYFNLHPSYDATLTPRIMSKRGLQLHGEFRYLTATSGGQLEAEYLHHDKTYGDQRSSVAYRHSGTFLQSWYSDITLNHASDNDYFTDLGSNLRMASITHLEKRGDLYYFGNGWVGLARLQTFQTLDDNPYARPYSRLPQLALKTNIPEANLAVNVEGEIDFSQFDRDVTITPGATGRRFNSYLALSYPWQTPGSFIIPKISAHYTRYDLENVLANQQSRIRRTLPSYSLDSGLFLERPLQFNNKAYLQTLEPRLLYRYTPYEDQTGIPIFDTAPYDLTFNQLFRETTYSGPDRINDANQLSIGLTSRFLEKRTGREQFRGSIGQIRYFDEQQVTMPGHSPPIEDSSSFIAELAAYYDKVWMGSTTYRWNPHDSNSEYSVWRLRYQDVDNQHLLNFSYRLREKKLEQTDIAWYWRLNPRWKVLGRWNYSLHYETELETFLGVEYQSCCWAVRAIARRYLDDLQQEDYVNGFFLQVQLRGLGGIGKQADEFLEHSIPGYYDDF